MSAPFGAACVFGMVGAAKETGFRQCWLLDRIRRTGRFAARCARASCPQSLLLWAAVLAMGWSGSVRAQGYGDPIEGHRMATQWCANCHVVERSAPSATSTGAPSFMAIARITSLNRTALQVFLQTPHSRMPDLHLSRDEADDLIAYIESLRPGG